MLELRRDSAHHLELASEVVRAEELLLDAALCGDPDLPAALAVRHERGDRRAGLLEVARLR